MPLNSLPPTCTVDALQIKRKAADGRCHVDVGFWGGAIPGNIDDLRGLHDEGVFGFKCFLAPSGVDEFPPLSVVELERYLAGARRVRRHDDRARRGRRRAGAGARGARASVRRFPRLPAARRREPRDRRAHRGRPAHRCRGAPAASVQFGRGADGALGPSRRDRHHGRDVPALPRLRGPVDRRGGDAVQVLPAHPGGRQPRGPLGGAGPWRRRLRRLRPLALRPRAEGSRARRLRRGLGRHLVAADRAARRLDRGAAARARHRRRRALDGAAPRRDRGPHPEGPDRARLRRRPRRVRAGRRVRRQSAGGSTTATLSRRTPTVPSRAWCGAPGCVARRSPIASRAAV